MANIIKCEDCGSILQALVPGDEDTCDANLTSFEAQVEGEKAPKHKPVVEIDGDNVSVKVGEVQHPMDDDHYIQFIIVGVGNEQYAKCFKPGDVPEATFTIGADKIADGIVAEAFCNLHGLWSSE